MQKISRKALSQTANILLSVILILSAGLLIYITVCAVRGKPVWIGKTCVMQVITGSMEPTLHVDECIVMEKADPETLREGEIIAYVSEASDIYGKIVTHRISAVLDDGTFEMRGDANPVSDRLHVRKDQIVGRYTGKAPFFTWMMSFADMRKSFMLVIMLIVLAVAVYELRTVILVGREVREESREEKRERLMREAIDREIERLKAAGLSGQTAAVQTLPEQQPAPQQSKPEPKAEKQQTGTATQKQPAKQQTPPQKPQNASKTKKKKKRKKKQTGKKSQHKQHRRKGR